MNAIVVRILLFAKIKLSDFVIVHSRASVVVMH